MKSYTFLMTTRIPNAKADFFVVLRYIKTEFWTNII